MEAWLSGPVPGVLPELVPAAHMVLQARAELESAVQGLPPGALWHEPAGAASVGFHLRHIAGSTDRLLTYARGEALTDVQRTALEAEKQSGTATADELLALALSAIDRALEVYRGTRVDRVYEERRVGRAQLPSSVFGLLYHIAEHTVRHTGQVIVTAKLVRAMERA